MSDWVKINRDLLGHWLTDSPEALSVWIRLCLEASTENTVRRFRGALVELECGQLLFGLNDFSEKTGISIAKLRRILGEMENNSLISRQKFNKYSIISICSDELYSFDDSQKSKQKTVKDKSKKYSSDDYKAAEYIWGLIRVMDPDKKEPNLERWADDVRLMREQDGREHREICYVFKWANRDDFWRSNVLSIRKLRQHFSRMKIIMNENRGSLGSVGNESFKDRHTDTTWAESIDEQKTKTVN